jgi:FixJ family two-component response regulator
MSEYTRAPFTPARRLTPTQWKVIALMWHEELNYDGVAQRLGISVRTVKMHVENAACFLPGYGPSSWRVLRHAETLLEAGHSDRDDEAA